MVRAPAANAASSTRGAGLLGRADLRDDTKEEVRDETSDTERMTGQADGPQEA